MTTAEKNAKLEALKTEAKDIQARLGYIYLQQEAMAKEVEKLRTVLEYQEAKFTELSREQVNDE